MAITIEAGWKRVPKLKLCSTFHVSSRSSETGKTRFLAFGNEPHLPLPARLADATRDRVPFIRSWTTPEGEPLVLRSSDAGNEYLLTKATADRHVIVSVKGPLGHAALSWKNRLLYVSFHAPEGPKRIDRIEMGSGKRRTVYESSILHDVTLSHREELVHWPLLDFGSIEILSSKGRSSKLTEFGWFPAFSKRGDMAFLMGDHTLWLRTSSGRMSRIASRWSPVDTAQTDFPSWCPCGRHVAAQIGGAYPDKWLARDLVITDVVSKQVMLIEQCVHAPAANRCESGWSGESA